MSKQAIQAALDKALEPELHQCFVGYPGGFCTSLPCACIEAIVEAALTAEQQHRNRSGRSANRARAR